MPSPRSAGLLTRVIRSITFAVPMHASTNRDASPSLTLSNVSFGYPGIAIFDDVSITIPAEGLTQVVGPNGGGKTTLARLLIGLMRPQRGTINVMGRSPLAARRLVGYVPQHALYDPRFPAVVQDVVLTGRLKRPIGPYSRRDREATLATLADLGLESLANAAFSTLSGGQRQRVLLARALVSSPDLLILDEPTANIDRESAARLETLIRAQRDRLGILLITHDFDFLADSVDRVLCVNRNVHIHERSDLSEDDLARLFTGHFHSLAGHVHG